MRLLSICLIMLGIIMFGCIENLPFSEQPEKTTEIQTPPQPIKQNSHDYLDFYIAEGYHYQDREIHDIEMELDIQGIYNARLEGTDAPRETNNIIGCFNIPKLTPVISVNGTITNIEDKEECYLIGNLKDYEKLEFEISFSSYKYATNSSTILTIYECEELSPDKSTCYSKRELNKKILYVTTGNQAFNQEAITSAQAKLG